MKTIWLAFAALLFSGCVGIPDGITPVEGFDVHRYLGKWYEIARLDHSFERGLVKVTAEYALQDDGGVSVVNRGYDSGSGQWKTATGKAFFVDARDRGYLKVSFFGPFYGSYIVFELDREYRYAFVCGPNRSYLWLLSRTPSVDEALIRAFAGRARELGFDLAGLVMVAQE